MELQLIWIDYTSGLLKMNLPLCPSKSWPKQCGAQDIWYYLGFPENCFTSPKHKGDFEEKQIALSSISKRFLSMHTLCWIKIALNPRLSKLITLKKNKQTLSGGQRRHNWDTIKGPLVSVSATWNAILVSFYVWHWDTDCKEQSKHEYGDMGNRVWLPSSPFYISFSTSDQVPFQD